MCALSYGHSLPIYRHFVYGFFLFIKNLVIISISTNNQRPCECDPLSPCISLVNNFIDQINPYWSTLINYPHHHID